MKIYNHKIQWVFPVRGVFGHTETELINDIENVLRIFGLRMFSSINFLDDDYKKTGVSPCLYVYLPDEELKNELKKIISTLEENKKIKYIEIIRK